MKEDVTATDRSGELPNDHATAEQVEPLRQPATSISAADAHSPASSTARVQWSAVRATGTPRAYEAADAKAADVTEKEPLNSGDSKAGGGKTEAREAALRDVELAPVVVQPKVLATEADELASSSAPAQLEQLKVGDSGPPAVPDPRVLAENNMEAQPVKGEDNVNLATVKTDVGYLDIFRQWVVLGWTAFGGPSAHIGLFQKVFVERLDWLSVTAFLELLALAQFLPGPSSTQVSFAIGVVKRGIPGGLLSGVLFQYPGLIIMSLVGLGAAKWLANPDRWLQCFTAGLGAVGVALVASSARGLSKNICKTRVTMAICAASAVIAYYHTAAYIFPALIAAGGLITIYTKRNDDVDPKEVDESVEHLGLNRFWGSLLLVTWLGILIATVVVKDSIAYDRAPELHWWEAFYRNGSIIWGGGQVVLPILYNTVVSGGCQYNPSDRGASCQTTSDSWITPNEFYTGLAVVQAMPGPLFNLAAYLGAVIAKRRGVFALWGILICWVGLFLPGVMLIYGLLPWWGTFRKFRIYRRALPGLNSGAIGLIYTALFQLGLQLWEISPFPRTTICIGIVGYALVDFGGVPAPLAIIVGGVLGIIGWGAHMH